MDRQIVYPGSIPLDTDILSIQRNVMVALGYLAQVTLGTTTVADGLACGATSPASLSVVVGPGSITQLGVVDTSAFGSLPPLPSDPLVRIGVNLDSMSFILTAPASPGQSINYLIEASLLEADATPVVLPYYNAANPSQPYSGPGNSGAAQMTQRLQSVQLQVKPGAPSTTGSQATPAVDVGWVGLYVVSVAYGQAAVTSDDITTMITAPFIRWKLPRLTPGTQNLAVFEPTTQGNWIVPAGVTIVKARIWGGGGAGGDGDSGAGGGGAAGGYSEGFYAVSPGQVIYVTVGNGGAGAGSSGGNSSFGVLGVALGGAPGASGSSGVGGGGAGSGGAGAGSGLSVTGGGGGDPFLVSGSWNSGAGGNGYGSNGGLPVWGTPTQVVAGQTGVGPGGGGSGGVGLGLGGNGAPGLVLVEW